MFTTKHAKSQYSEWEGVKAREVAERPLTLKDFEIYQLNGNAAAIAIFEELIPEKKKVYLTKFLGNFKFSPHRFLLCRFLFARMIYLQI